MQCCAAQIKVTVSETLRLEFLKLKRLGELQTALKPLLDKRGLRAQFTKHYSGLHISFRNEDTGLRHAVEIVVGSSLFTDTPDPWKGSYLSIADAGEVPLGIKGWKFLDWGYPTDTAKFSGDTEQAFDQIRKYLKEYPVLRVGKTHPGLIDESDFVEVFREIEQAVTDKTNNRMAVERVDGVLSINFKIWEDKWRIDFPNFTAKLSVNGEKLGEVSTTRARDVDMKLREEFSKREVPTLGF